MEISALEFSHDGTKVAVIVNNCDYVHILEAESGKIITIIKVCNTTIRDIFLMLVIYIITRNSIENRAFSVFSRQNLVPEQLLGILQPILQGFFAA